MKITKIECFVLLVPDYRADACSSAQDDLVVKIHTDEGLVGIGETDTNPWVARAMIEAPGTHIMGLGLTEMLIGKDPTDVEGLWDKMYTGLRDDRRRGPASAPWALDMALGICAARRRASRAGSCSAAPSTMRSHRMPRCCRKATIWRPTRVSWSSAP
jgi:L-alanine-DL-glutamate epimerase-like enolase superfamily enzyme